MLFCGQPLRAFYSECGWTPVESARIFYGERSNPMLKSDNLVMMMFVSQKGLAARGIFEAEEVYVGEGTW